MHWIARVLDTWRRRRNGRKIAAGYSRIPQTPEEVAWAEYVARRMIEAEPW